MPKCIENKFRHAVEKSKALEKREKQVKGCGPATAWILNWLNYKKTKKI